VAALMRAGGSTGRVLTRRPWKPLAIGTACCAAVLGAAGCSDVDPYEVTCRELMTSPDRLRETTLKLADKDVEAKVRYERQIGEICANAPEDYRPVQQIKPKG
jgi:hypothetical protein